MLIGYARVSTADQNPDLQLNALHQAGCHRVYVDQASGRNPERPELDAALQRVESGDTLVVWRLDRLGRNLRHLIEVTTALHQRGANFRSVHDGIDTSNANGRLWFHMMGALAEYERELIVERTNAGLAAARLSGQRGGRRPKITDDLKKDAIALLLAGRKPREVADRLSISQATLYRAVPNAGSYATRKS